MSVIDKSGFTTISDDFKNQSNKLVLSKIEDDLYKEEDNVVMPTIRVKHISLPNKGDRWRLFADDRLLMIIEGANLNKKERDYLRGLEGVSFMIAQVKTGIKSFNGMKVALKKHMRILTSKSK